MSIYDFMAEKIEAFGGRASYSLHSPSFSRRQARKVQTVVKSGLVSTYGPETENFEELLSAETKSIALATNSGTSALHLALVVAGVKAGDIVFCPAISFVATANAILYAGATPHFVDVDQDLMLSIADLRNTLQADFEVIDGRSLHRETGRVASAIMILHPLGTLYADAEVMKVALDYGLEIVEDGAQAFGSSSGPRNQGLGSLGRLTAISFNGNKILTTGAGGALLMSNREDYEEAKMLATVGRMTGPRAEMSHSKLGFNYRMPALNAALGLASMDSFARTLELKRKVRTFYQDLCRSLNLMLVHEGEVGSNFWLNAIVVENEPIEVAIQAFERRGLGVRRLWQPLPTLPHLRSYPSSSGEKYLRFASSVLCLPSSPGMAEGRY